MCCKVSITVPKVFKCITNTSIYINKAKKCIKNTLLKNHTQKHLQNQMVLTVPKLMDFCRMLHYLLNKMEL